MGPKSGELVPLLLDALDLGQTLDALDTRAECYERTAAYLDGESGDDGDDPFSIEEVDDADEARGIAAYFREIEDSLQAQWDAWRAGRQAG